MTTTMNNKFKVTFEGHGTTVNVDVSSDVAHDLLKQIFSQKEKEIIQTVNFKDMSARQKISIWEKFNAKRNIEKITVIGYLLKNDKDWIMRKDIDNFLELHGDPIIKNFSRDINWAIQVGFLEENKEELGKFKITKIGIEAVNKKFPSNIKKDSKLNFQKKKTEL